jgi:hypothetical protein
VPKQDLGEWIDSANVRERDSNEYRRLYEMDHANYGVDRLEELNVSPTWNPIWACVGERLPITNLSCLPKPDVLHTVLLGVLTHLMEWNVKFLKEVKRMDLFDAVFRCVPSYLKRPAQTKTFTEVTQWGGKDMRNYAHSVLACLYVSLRGIHNRHRESAGKVIRATKALVEFFFYCQYRSHNQDTLNDMQHCLKAFHDNKSVYLHFRASKTQRAKVADTMKKLRGERDKGRLFLNSTQRKRYDDDWRHKLTEKEMELMESCADFAFPKLHLVEHFVAQIKLYGTTSGVCTEISEKCHRPMLKVAYAHSNRNDNFQVQLIQYGMRHDAIKQVELAHLEAHVDDVFDCSIDDEISNSRSGGLPYFAAIHYTKLSVHGKVIKTAGDLEAHISVPCFYDELRHYLKKYSGIREFSMDYTEMAECPVNIYHQLRISVPALDSGEPVEQTLRCTINKRWKNSDKRRDWVFRKPRGNASYGALHGELPVRLHVLFDITVGKTVYEVAFVENTVPINGGRVDQDSGMFRVERSRRQSGFQVVDIAGMTGAAHMIPDEPLLSPEVQCSWVVNSHIDLETWNKVYEYDENM